ncbi:hypothetical protein [Chamaesiphon sp. VAR_48_metabat_135_sub]|uniref:hypothetical protein n=1 Tax=Chamaesiphon sp. VAR_48_metabat_135_sub TaxID=2964699 RepID=UPI00286D190A|nr:hypothetical protein [Chamaesiphon sp. VAR_48_metabat_135_sub]
MKQLLCYVSCCWMLSLSTATASYASSEVKPRINAVNADAANLQITTTPVVLKGILAQVPPPPPPAPTPASPANSDSKDLKEQLNNIKNTPGAPVEDKFTTYQPKASPSFSIFNPVGFGADNNLVFFSLSYQNRTRFTQKSDGEAGIGIGLGDAVNAVGVELSYSLNSFGTSTGFGSGAFNAKVHRRLGEDTAVAIGWNQFAKIQFGGGQNGPGSDYPNNSYYAVGTKIFRTREDINQAFSRVAVTAGVGSGVFLPSDPNGGLDRTGLNVFGSLGVRVARPVSAIVEWTGDDLGAGISIAPFDNFPLVITPAVRDITGGGDGARFILGASVAFNF